MNIYIYISSQHPTTVIHICCFSFVFVALLRPAQKHKQIGLLAPPRKIASGYDRK